VTAISAESPSSTLGGTEAAWTPPVGNDADAPLLMTAQGSRAAAWFPGIENFSEQLCSRFPKRGKTLRFRFFYMLLQGLARSCRELQGVDFGSGFMRRIFVIFCVAFSPFEGGLFRRC